MKPEQIPVFAVALALSLSAAHAGDRWQQCTVIAGDLFEYDGEALYEIDGDNRRELQHEKLQSITIEETEGYCEIKAGARFNWANHVYVVKLDIAGSEGPFNLWALCEEGGSGIPASSDPDMACVKNVDTMNRQLVPQYEDKAAE